MHNIWRVIRYIPEYKGRVAGVVAVGALVGAIGVVIPYIYKLVVDLIARLVSGRIAEDAAAGQIAATILLFVGARLLLVLFTALQDKQSDDLWLDTVGGFRQRVFDNVTRLSIDYFERTRAGEIVDRFGTITQITMWLTTLTDGVLASIIQLVFILAALLWKAPLAGLVMVFVIAANMVLSIRTVGATKPYRRGWQRLAGRMTGLLGETVGNISTVRSFGGEASVKARYDDTQAEWRVQRGTLHAIEWRSNLALSLVNAGGLCLVVALAAWSALNGRLGPGDVLFVLTLSNLLFATIGPIARQVNQAADIDAAAERLVELLEVDQQVADAPDAIPLERIDRIEFVGVGFTYPGSARPALKDVGFRLDRGQALALVGRSGSGKSTIIKLLLRFYDPNEGAIRINGRDLRSYTQASLRARLGVVLQDVALFNDSIAENIAFATPDKTIEDIRAAADVAQAAEFIDRLSEGYDTPVGERGIRLSGGEKQRLAIARAILRDPELVVLDEATSALDSAAEAMVQAGLDRLLSGRTSIAIAHRLSTIRGAHQILVLHDGSIVERGDHRSLIERPGGRYAEALTIQTGTPAKLDYPAPAGKPTALVGNLG